MLRSCFVFVGFFSVSAVGQLIPARPHEVGDALADLGTVVKVSLAHRPGLPARQLVAAENGGEKEGEEHWLDSHLHLCCVLSLCEKTAKALRRGRTQNSLLQK